MSIDDLMALAQTYANLKSITGHGPDARDSLRAAIESALRAEYERGRVAECALQALSDSSQALGGYSREQDAEPVAWRSKEIVNGEFVTDWCLTSAEPPNTPRTVAIEPLYSAPPRREPLTDEQIDAIRFNGYTQPTSRNWSEAECLRHFARAVERAHGIGDE